VSAGSYHTIALLDDGTVRAAGDNSFGQCDVRDWTDVTAIAAGSTHSLGVRKDGTVLAAGNNADKQCEVGTWQLHRL
jgi:alpha-tubulin suppressor-like RCC1 family protein